MKGGTATARVSISLDIDFSQPWSDEETAANIRDTAQRQAQEAIERAAQNIRDARVRSVVIEAISITMPIGKDGAS